jgi:hypothetical protein
MRTIMVWSRAKITSGTCESLVSLRYVCSGRQSRAKIDEAAAIRTSIPGLNCFRVCNHTEASATEIGLHRHHIVGKRAVDLGVFKEHLQFERMKKGTS